MLITDGKLYACISMTTYDGVSHSPDMSQDLLEGSYKRIGEYNGKALYKVDSLADVESYIYDWENYETEYDTEEERQYDKDMGQVRRGMFYIIELEETK